MKNQSIAILSTLSLLLLMNITSCTKGDVGPKGDAGPTGNANVVTSNYQTSSWTNGANFWYVDLSVAALTSSVQSSGAVEVFMSTDSGKNWLALPYTALNTTNYFMQFVTSVNQVEIQWLYNGIGNGSNPNSFYGSTCQFKVVVIPAAKIKPDIDHHDFNQVKSAYNIAN